MTYRQIFRVWVIAWSQITRLFYQIINMTNARDRHKHKNRLKEKCGDRQIAGVEENGKL